jgi:hypothetical protein
MTTNQTRLPLPNQQELPPLSPEELVFSTEDFMKKILSFSSPKDRMAIASVNKFWKTCTITQTRIDQNEAMSHFLTVLISYLNLEKYPAQRQKLESLKDDPSLLNAANLKEIKKFSNCAQGLSTLFFLFSWAFFAVCAAKVEQKGEVISSTYQYLTSYMRTIPWFSSGSFMENDI